MANRKNNTTTRRYNRLFHALQTVRNGNCPQHHIRMVGKEVVVCPKCGTKATKEGEGYKLAAESEHVVVDLLNR